MINRQELVRWFKQVTTTRRAFVLEKTEQGLQLVMHLRYEMDNDRVEALFEVTGMPSKFTSFLTEAKEIFERRKAQ